MTSEKFSEEEVDDLLRKGGFTKQNDFSLGEIISVRETLKLALKKGFEAGQKESVNCKFNMKKPALDCPCYKAGQKAEQEIRCNHNAIYYQARQDTIEEIKEIIRKRHGSCLNPSHGGLSCCNLILLDFEALKKGKEVKK